MTNNSDHTAAYTPYAYPAMSNKADNYFMNDMHAADSISALEDTLAQLAAEPAAQVADGAADTVSTQAPLRTHVERVVRAYFAALGDEMPTDLYALILKEVEAPLLKVVLEQTRGNQTKCAQVLGLNRGTLRKKLKMYGLME